MDQCYQKVTQKGRPFIRIIECRKRLFLCNGGARPFRMRVYETPFCNDELISDAYPCTPMPEIGALKFEGKYIQWTNPDEEGAQPQTVIDIVINQNLQPIDFAKSAFAGWAKSFMPKRRAQIKEQEPAKEAKFMDDAKKFVKFVGENFDKFTFFTGKSGDPDDLLLFCMHDEAGTTPFFYLLASAAIDEKC